MTNKRWSKKLPEECLGRLLVPTKDGEDLFFDDSPVLLWQILERRKARSRIPGVDPGTWPDYPDEATYDLVFLRHGEPIVVKNMLGKTFDQWLLLVGTEVIP